VSVQPNTDGYLVRTSSLPVNGTGWTAGFWFQRIGAVGSGLVETLFELVDNGDGDYIKIFVNDANEVHFQGINDFDDVSLFTATLNTWYYIALVTTSSTTGNVYWRADASGSLSSSTGRKFQTDNGWDSLTLLNNAGTLEVAEHFRMTSYKEWASALSSGQLLTESQSRAPVAGSSVCYLPFTTASGTDQSGSGRNFTVNGTLAANASEPSSMADGVTSSVAGALSLTAAASVQVRNAATIAGSLSLTAAAQMPVTNRAQVAGSLSLAASAAMPVTNRAQVAGAMALVGAATLQTTLPVSIAGGFSLAAAASMQVTNRAQIAGALSLVASASINAGAGPSVSRRPRVDVRRNRGGRYR